MNKYTILTGPGRCGTLWLMQMFDQWAIDTKFYHDFFLPLAYEPNAQVFEAVQAEHVGTASGPARYVLPRLKARLGNFHCHFLWREPHAQVRSLVEMNHQGLSEDVKRDQCQILDFTLRRVAQLIYGDLESCLAMADKHEIHVRHWHMDDFTTSAGFQALAEACTIKLRPEWQLLYKANSMPDEDRIAPIENWEQHTKEYIWEVVRSLPRVNAALTESLVGGERRSKNGGPK